MAHVRQQIREAATATLIAAGTMAGPRWYPARAWPIGREELPAGLVYTAEEESERLSQVAAGGVGSLWRSVQLRLQLTVAGEDGEETDDALDAFAAQAEAALGGQSLGGLVKDLVLAESTAVITAEGETVAGARLLTYQAIYVTAENDPETAL